MADTTTPALNPVAALYHVAHVRASNANIPSERLQKLGKAISDLHHAGVQGPLPAKTTRRELKKAQLHALGAIAVMMFSDPDFLDGLSLVEGATLLCGDKCPHHAASTSATLAALTTAADDQTRHDS